MPVHAIGLPPAPIEGDESLDRRAQETYISTKYIYRAMEKGKPIRCLQEKLAVRGIAQASIDDEILQPEVKLIQCGLEDYSLQLQWSM